jgi:hypothetical protein
MINFHSIASSQIHLPHKFEKKKPYRLKRLFCFLDYGFKPFAT